MRHPTDGTVRRLLDEPAGVADADREHVAACPQCLKGLAGAQQDAALSRAALTVDPALDPAADVDVDTGWSRLSHAVAVDQRRRLAVPAQAPRWRAALRSPVVAVIGVAVLLTGASAAAAADWLQIFRTEQITPVLVNEADLVALPDLSAYGDIELIEDGDVHEVPDAASAAAATGLAVPRVGELPRGVTGAPTYLVGGEVSVVFTLSTARAAEAAAATGETPPPPPPGLDGSQFRLTAGPGVAEVWSESRGVPALIVARVIAPAAYSSGISFETARDYLLSLPGLPENVAEQLRAFAGVGTTLPLPVPAGLVATSAADVGGVSATVLTSRDGAMAGVVWVQAGVVTAVAGSLSTDEVLSVARGMQEW